MSHSGWLHLNEVNELSAHERLWNNPMRVSEWDVTKTEKERYMIVTERHLWHFCLLHISYKWLSRCVWARRRAYRTINRMVWFLWVAPNTKVLLHIICDCYYMHFAVSEMLVAPWLVKADADAFTANMRSSIWLTGITAAWVCSPCLDGVCVVGP